ncbi:siderophore-interacting protein [Micromonospora sp. LOL_021]|uniref:siderophore-interacting protein n=1 Tax=Micromonospora sp. LOL_021 TaxID=3345417 RepID=UPI003A84F466
MPPTTTGWRLRRRTRAFPSSTRGTDLTIRRARPAADEIDIEFALHGDSPMSSWARNAEPGTPAVIFDIGTRYRRL